MLVRLFNVSTGESVDHVALNIRFFFSFLYWWMLIFFVCVWLTGCCCCLGFALLFRSLAQRDSTKGQHNEYPTFSTAVAFSYSPPPLSIVSSLGFFPLPKRPGVSFSRWEEAPLLFSPRFQVLRKSNNIPFNRKMRFQFPVWEQFQRFHPFPNSMASIPTDCYTDISFLFLSFFVF